MSGHNTPYHLYQGPLSLGTQTATATIGIDRNPCYVPVDTTGGAITLTMAAPSKAGIIATVCLEVDGGDLTLTVTNGYNYDADTDITFADAGGTATFISIDIGGTKYWRLIAQEKTNAATEEGTFDTLTATTATATTLTATTLKLAVTAVAAAGSTIGEGGDLVAGLNVVSAADNTACVDLPAASAGTVVVVSSQTANRSLPVFPAVNESIDNLAANAAKTIGAATATTGAVFVGDNSTHWVTVLGDTA